MRVNHRKSLKLKTKPVYSRAGKQNLPMHANISATEIDAINELLRMHKRSGTTGKESWRLLPKDSCEVYRSRKRRNTIKKKEEENNKRRHVENPKSVVRFKRAKTANNRRSRKKRQTTNTPRRRQLSSSSCSSESYVYDTQESSICHTSDTEMESE